MNSAEATGQERVGPYRVVKAIGAGGTARIDLARVERAYGFERDIVLKRPLEHLRTSSAVAATLRREASLGGRLRHPNIVAVLDAGQHDGYDYLALEYVRGVSLRAAIEAAANGGAIRRLPLDAALSIVIGVAYGLHFAHELLGDDGLPLGLVHRDVSPGNVLIAYDGTVKLSDFGIAKDTHIDTLSGSLRGTVTYMAPEQCRGHAFDRRADVFSLGVILHELITGRRLFWADNDVASLHRVLSGSIPDPREIDSGIAAELAAIAMHALAGDAGDRITSARELADRLERFASRAGVLTSPRMIERALAPRTGEPGAAESARLTATRLSLATDFATEVTVVEPAPSLVDVIHAAPESDLAMPAPAPSQPPPVTAPRPARRRRGLAIVIATSIAIGVPVTILALRKPAPSAPGATPVAAPPVAAPPATATSRGSASIAKPAAESRDARPPPLDTTPPVTSRPPKSANPPVRRRPQAPAQPNPRVAPVVRTPDVGGAATAPAAGSGSNVTRKTPPRKVEWTPGLLLPSDTGSQRGSNR